jgi:hypothetical protein
MIEEFDEFDDSINGSFKVKENPIIETKEGKSIYKENTDHRFNYDYEHRIRSDKPIISIYDKSKKWRTVADIVDETGLAERTVHHACKRMVRHEIMEQKTERIPDTNGSKRPTKLYRLMTK